MICCDEISCEEMSVWRNVRVTKCPVTICPVTKCPCDGMSVWRNILWRNVLVTNCPCDQMVVTKCPPTQTIDIFLSSCNIQTHLLKRWGPLEMEEGWGPLGNRHPATRLLRPPLILNHVIHPFIWTHSTLLQQFELFFSVLGCSSIMLSRRYNRNLLP